MAKSMAEKSWVLMQFEQTKYTNSEVRKYRIQYNNIVNKQIYIDLTVLIVIFAIEAVLWILCYVWK